MSENEVGGNQTKNVGGDATHIQIYNVVTSENPSWQSLIYDMINSGQIDPWDVDISLICKNYYEKIRQLEESNFRVSSTLLLAASILLRIKSEILVEKYLKEVDDILFGRTEEEKQRIVERIILNENELPLLMSKSPLPRFKKVTVEELMAALDTAIKTESRRIDREIDKKQRERLARVDIPKFRAVNIKERIRQFYAKILTGFKHPEHKGKLKLPYSHFTKNVKQEKLAYFLPLLHLSNRSKLWLEQNGHFEEIYIYLYEVFKNNYPDYDSGLKELQEEIEEVKREMDEEAKAEDIEEIIEEKIENPLKGITDSEINL